MGTQQCRAAAGGSLRVQLLPSSWDTGQHAEPIWRVSIYYECIQKTTTALLPHLWQAAYVLASKRRYLQDTLQHPESCWKPGCMRKPVAIRGLMQGHHPLTCCLHSQSTQPSQQHHRPMSGKYPMYLTQRLGKMGPWPCVQVASL